VMVTGAAIDPRSGSSELDCEWQRTTPAVSVVAHSAALDDLSGESLEIKARNGVVTFTVRDANGRGLPGAKVSLDGDTPKTTDDAGQISFTYSTGGEHEIAIEKEGFLSQSLKVQLS